jgi:hypothetical protein
MVSWDKAVYSSMVQSIAYDSDSNVMVVTFNSGKSYAYANVPEDVAMDASNAASVGEFINSEIKGRYSYRRL